MCFLQNVDKSLFLQKRWSSAASPESPVNISINTRESPQGRCQDRSNCLFVKNEYEFSLLYSPTWIMLLQTPSSIEWLFLWFWFLLFLISFSLNLSHFVISLNDFSKIVSYPAKITGWSSYVMMEVTWTQQRPEQLVVNWEPNKLQINSKYRCVARQIIFQLYSMASHHDPPWTPKYVTPLNMRKILQNSKLLLSSSMFFSFCKSLGRRCLNVSLCSI